MRLFKFSIIAMLFLAVACATSDRVAFYGDIKIVDYPNQEDILKGYPVKLEGEYTGSMYVYDGILVFQSHKHQASWLYLYDSETGKRVNAICKIGEGPDEYTHFEPFNGTFEKHSDGTCLWINNKARNRIELLNMRGEIVKQFDVLKFESTNPYGFGSFYVLNDSLLWAYVSTIKIFENKYSAPSHYIFNYKLGKIVNKYTFYSNYETDDRTDIWPDSYLTSTACGMKSDRTKLALAMPFLKRVDILDFKSGKMKSVQMRDSPDLNSISLDVRLNRHYWGSICDDRYIYVAEGSYEQFFGTIQIFDWDGNFVRVLRINEEGYEKGYVFALDPVRKILYTKNDAEEVTAYDVNYLYE
ncbi:MAG: hypothetical protein LBU91_05695 [Bacteroidales bacterium]|jgi:hypothetical protein|nr:hypothetical protein [Bacteroidales bacterium]